MRPLKQWLSGLRAWLAAWVGRIPRIPRRRPRSHSQSVPERLAPAARDAPPGVALPMQPYATVVIPALNEARRIAHVVAYALADPATAEVLVIDDSSTDSTADLARSAGARVLTSSMLGKGASMRDGVVSARCTILVYLDGDLAGLRSGIITDLCAPLLRGEADFVKARFGRNAGRVTELTAKPMLRVFFPELAHIAQPLGGVIAARRSLLQALSFEDGYGVDIGLLLDAHRHGARVVEVDIGSLEHDSQALHDLALMANEVGRVIFQRARAAGRLHVDQIAAMYESQRQAAAGIDYVLTRRKARRRLLLLDMDGTVTSSTYVEELARAAGLHSALAPLLDEGDDGPPGRQARTAALFQYLHRTLFERVARDIEIRPGVIEFVNQMRRRGFMVGLLSDSYFVGADIVRRRIFADFAMAHTLQFDNDVCTGQMRINPAFADGDSAHELCKRHVLQRFLDDPHPPPIDLTWVIGDAMDDLPLMRMANRAFAIDPKAQALRDAACAQTIDSFADLLALLPNHELVDDPAL